MESKIRNKYKIKVYRLGKFSVASIAQKKNWLGFWKQVRGTWSGYIDTRKYGLEKAIQLAHAESLKLLREKFQMELDNEKIKQWNNDPNNKIKDFTAQLTSYSND